MSLKTFKEILNECNSVENKQQALFERVYFECNVEPLYEQVLREMGRNYSVSTGGNYATIVDNKIREISAETVKQIKMAKKQNINTDEIRKKQNDQLLEVWSDSSIRDSVLKTIQKGLTGNNQFILEYTNDENAVESDKISKWLNNLKNTIQEKLIKTVPRKNGKPDLDYFKKIINIFIEHLKLNQ